MTVDCILQTLTRVKRTGQDRWVACCPAHDSKSQASLALREMDDGRVLLHCFGGCNVDSVLGAIGLQMEDLFPPRDNAPGAGHARVRRPFNAVDFFDVAAWEVSVACVVAIDIVNGRADADVDRLLLAASRLADLSEVAHAR